MPPPTELALFPLTVLLISVAVASIVEMPPARLALLPITVLRQRQCTTIVEDAATSKRSCSIIPNSDSVEFTVLPELITKSPSLGRRLPLPSMIVLNAPPPVIVRLR